MKTTPVALRLLTILMVISLITCFSSCSGEESSDADVSRYIVTVWEEPDTVDFQCTTLFYNVAYNVYDRLVRMDADDRGEAFIQPSLAESWEVSDDGCLYTFHLRKGVTFSNGSPLTASDVEYTFSRLLTHPDSCNKEVAEPIKGAAALEEGTADGLAGFKVLSDYVFSIELSRPFEAFLACISMPGASILDEETTEEAGERFGLYPETMIGTGPFVLDEWTPGEGMLLSANKDCWAGAPAAGGIDVRFVKDSEEIRSMFENEELDILNLDELDNSAEYFIHGDVYSDRLYEAQLLATSYIALNESIAPLDDVRVRKALQLGLDRGMILDTVNSGRGTLENGIYPHGLYGFDPELKEIPYDPEKARDLLREAGYPDGIDLTVSIKSTSTQTEMLRMQTAAKMWKDIGVRADIRVIDESEFLDLRKSGKLECYTAAWTADYNDPDNFIYTFFGNRRNTDFRSLCYPDEEIMERVRNARTITDHDERIQEYRDLEKKIIREDAAWIPLFSAKRYYVVSERLSGFKVGWNGSFFMNYYLMSVDQ